MIDSSFWYKGLLCVFWILPHLNHNILSSITPVCWSRRSCVFQTRYPPFSSQNIQQKKLPTIFRGRVKWPLAPCKFFSIFLHIIIFNFISSKLDIHWGPYNEMTTALVNTIASGIFLQKKWKRRQCICTIYIYVTNCIIVRNEHLWTLLELELTLGLTTPVIVS